MPRCNTCTHVWAYTSQHVGPNKNNSALPTSDKYCCVSCSSRPSAPSRKPLPTVFEPGATVTFHFVCSSCFLPLKPNPSAIASVCFGSCVQEKPSAFHAPFLCHGCQESRANTFTVFTLNTSRIDCSRSSALSSGKLKMKSSPQCTPSASSCALPYKHGTTAFLWKPCSLGPDSTYVANT